MFDDLDLFVTIVEAGSLQAAAERTGIPAATVTRRLQSLERRLGHKLLQRTARRMTLTTEGTQYYEQCRPLIHALRQATRQLDDVLDALSGHIRVLAPTGLASGILTPAWSAFLARHRDISLELQLSNAVQDLAGSGADLAIRIGDLQDSSLMQRRLGATRLLLAAAPAYLARAGAPADAAALNGHDVIVVEPLNRWRLVDPHSGADTELRPAPRMRVDDMRLAVASAVDGGGILLCPEVQCSAELASGALVEVLPGWVRELRQIYAVWAQQRYLPARVRALLEHLAQAVAAEPLLQH